MSDVTRFFHPVMAAGRLKQGPVRVEIAGRRFAVWRDINGRPAAVADACPHRLAPLSKGKVQPDGRLACAYHGWNFDANGSGRSPAQPTLTTCDTVSYRVLEKFDYLWLASRDAMLSSFPEIGWEGFELAGSFESLFRAPLHVALDNFSEDEHFPFIHSFLGWDQNGMDRVEFEARNFEDRSEAVYRGPQRSSPWLPLLGVKAGDRFENYWVTRFNPVHAVFTFHWFDSRSGVARPLVTRTAVFMVPETSVTTRFHIFIFMKIAPSFYRWIRPLVYRATTFIGRRDVQNDADWIPNVAETPLTLEGMRLGRFDKPLIRNRKLLKSIYWRNTGSDVPRGTPELEAVTENRPRILSERQ